MCVRPTQPLYDESAYTATAQRSVEADRRFLDFILARIPPPNPSALAGVVVTLPNMLGPHGTPQKEWRFENMGVQLMWECWQDGHAAGAEDSF